MMNRMHGCMLLVFLMILPGSALAALVPDSVTLFHQQYAPDAKVRLGALENIYLKFYRNDYTRGVPYAWKALVLANRLGDVPRQIQARIYLASWAYDRHNLKQGLDLLRTAREQSINIRDRKLAARVSAFLATIYQELGDHLHAIKYARESIKYDTSQPETLARNYLTLGIVFADAGNFTQAAGFYHQSLTIKEKLKDTGAITVLYCNLSDIYTKIGNASKALDYTEIALRYAERSGDVTNQAYCLNGLGSYWFLCKDFGKALGCYRKALLKRSSLMDFQGSAFVLTNMGEVYLQLGRLDSARSCFLRSLRCSDRAGDKISRCCTYLSLSRLGIRQGAYQQAQDYAGKSLQITEEVNYRTYQEEIYGVMSAIADSMGNSRHALALLQKRNEIRDSAYKEKAQQLVTDMMIRYELDKHQDEIVDLNLQVTHKNRRITLFTLALSGILILGILITIVIYRVYRKKLHPKVVSLSYIQEKILEEARKDSRRMRSLKKILPPEMDTTGEPKVATNGREESLIQDLERLMSVDKPYLHDDLSLSDVAQILKTNTAYLSRLINDTYHDNFNIYINRYRVELAKQLIRENEHARLSYEGIAHSVGFRSRSTFYQAFKSITGQTPSEFAASLNP